MDFDDYVRARGAALVRLARLLTGDRHRGEDLAQEVLARAFARWNRISAANPEAYLRRMLVNASITRWRRLSSREIVVADTGDPASRRDLESEFVERDALWRHVRQLPAKQRAAIVLRYYEDLDDASIAALLSCSTVTVRTQVKRALATLRGKVGADVALTPTGGRDD
ncbi:SigE family RNA polymerase sigma factor [Micromonospora costi]|uniref:SigE family RNA polymerase sigma factor n=1 Tax=Micromonospora costi TaxID=1530042 RepID=A0A3A9ZXD5_9ACTN|nr:SigE family RNA polymerase sigma factor [Micromonospora costi]RKN52982.1 SigE family RNA polymerase sigma factor [Micromonospora costi]